MYLLTLQTVRHGSTVLYGNYSTNNNTTPPFQSSWQLCRRRHVWYIDVRLREPPCVSSHELAVVAVVFLFLKRGQIFPRNIPGRNPPISRPSRLPTWRSLHEIEPRGSDKPFGAQWRPFCHLRSLKMPYTFRQGDLPKLTLKWTKDQISSSGMPNGKPTEPYQDSLMKKQPNRPTFFAYASPVTPSPRSTNWAWHKTGKWPSCHRWGTQKPCEGTNKRHCRT